jgi:hypothetical protein
MIELFSDAYTVPLQEIEKEYRNHSVIVDFIYKSSDPDPILELEDKLYELLDNPETGCYDGYELCLVTREATLFFYGPNAEKLFKTIKCRLDATGFLKGAVARLIFGPQSEVSNEIEVVIGTDN